MEILWDEPKRLSNIDKHAMDFAVLTDEFFDEALVGNGKQGRSIAIGRLGGWAAASSPSSSRGLAWKRYPLSACVRRAWPKGNTMKHRKFEPGHGYSKEDWDAVDSPELTAEELAQLQPFRTAFPDLAASIKRKAGRPKLESPKSAVTLRLDPKTVERFKATGPDWRARMASALDKAKL